MPYRIEITSTIEDSRNVKLLQQMAGIGTTHIDYGWVSDVYTIDKALDMSQLQQIGALLANPVTQKVTIQNGAKKGVANGMSKPFTWAVEIGYLPGVTDNVGRTARDTITALTAIDFADTELVFTSTLYFFAGRLSHQEIDILSNQLYNPLIMRRHIKAFPRFMADGGMDVIVPKVNHALVCRVNLDRSDIELSEIGKKGVPNPEPPFRGPLALDLTYLKTIQAHFQTLDRMPTDVELETLAQTWSEHCKHTIFADPIDELEEGLYKSYIQKATQGIRAQRGKDDWCVSVFTDNSGAILLDDQYLITHKVETHNSPSALDPFGGAITGIVGVNRDALGFGLGAKPVANTYGFCLADPQDESVLYRDAAQTQPMLSARRIMEGVIAGVNAGGNCSGIPTPQGFLYFDARYRGKPLVFVGTLGLIPRTIGDQPGHHKHAQAGDYIVVCGGRVGKDGIHGATFSSQALDTGSPVSAVQIGDPITQKKLSDALVKEARDQGLYHSITDNGAGGLSCSVAEMAKECGGCEVHLDTVPVKYPGLKPWEIWISESQERMTLAVPPSKWKRLKQLLRSRGVEATKIGLFTDQNKCLVYWNGQVVVDLDMEFLHYGLPKIRQTTKPVKIPFKKLTIVTPKEVMRPLLALLKRPHLASMSFLSQQYDHEVRGGSVLKPLQGKGQVNGDASVFRPVLHRDKVVAISHGLNPAYSDLDAYQMAAGAIDTAIRNLIAVGAPLDKIALLDNFCWCSSREPERLYQLKQAAKACYDLATAYQTPFISGKDSMFNDFNGFDSQGKAIKISIPPTLLISSLAVLANPLGVVSMDFKATGDLIYVIGETLEQLGGSEYASLLGNKGEGSVPVVTPATNRQNYRALEKAIQADLVSAAVSVHRGGLGYALARMAMAGGLGMSIDLAQVPGTIERDDYALFSETQGRLVVTVCPKQQVAFEALLKGVPYGCIGAVAKTNAVVIAGKKDHKTTVEAMLQAYREPFKDY